MVRSKPDSSYLRSLFFEVTMRVTRKGFSAPITPDYLF
jgi:hypothetical protein